MSLVGKLLRQDTWLGGDTRLPTKHLLRLFTSGLIYPCKLLQTIAAQGSIPNVKCPENVEKVQKNGGSDLKIKKSTIQNVNYFEMKGGEPDFQLFPKFKRLKYLSKPKFNYWM